MNTREDDHHISPVPPAMPPQQWPQRVSYGWLAALAMALIGAGIGVLSVMLGIRRDEAGITIGFAALTLMIILVSIGMLQFVGFRWIRLSSRISSTTTEHGVGIKIPADRSILLLVVLLACGAVSGLTAAATWYMDFGETLLPASRDNRGGANVMAILGAAGLVMAILFLMFRAPATLQLTPSGVRYHIRRHCFFRTIDIDNCADWSDIISIIPETHIIPNSFSDLHNPLVRVTVRQSSSTSTDIASDEEILIRAHLLVSEPNTLLSLINRMKDHPEDRELLAEPESRKLLMPPPLRARFRSARKSKSSLGTDSGGGAPPDV